VKAGELIEPDFDRALAETNWNRYGALRDEQLPSAVADFDEAERTMLDALAGDFARSGYNLRALVRSILVSRTYQLGSRANELNADDTAYFSHAYTKLLPAEVLLDAISQVTGMPSAFNGLPAGTRAIELPDEAIASSFLDAFGRPKRDTPCECERVSDASLGQSLMLLNSGEVQGKLSAAGGRAEALAKDPRPHAEKVEELFWTAFGRAPSSGETASALDHLTARPDKTREAYEDIIWALVNAKEFQFND